MSVTVHWTYNTIPSVEPLGSHSPANYIPCNIPSDGLPQPLRTPFLCSMFTFQAHLASWEFSGFNLDLLVNSPPESKAGR